MHACLQSWACCDVQQACSTGLTVKRMLRTLNIRVVCIMGMIPGVRSLCRYKSICGLQHQLLLAGGACAGFVSSQRCSSGRARRVNQVAPKVAVGHMLAAGFCGRCGLGQSQMHRHLASALNNNGRSCSCI